MPIAVTCQQCRAKLSAPDAAAGKRVKYPKCQAFLQVPEEYVVEEEEYVAEEEPAPRSSAKPSKLATESEDEEDERPRPRRRRDLKDGRIRRKSDKSKRKLPMLLAGFGVGAAIAVGIVAVLLFRGRSGSNEVAENSIPDPVRQGTKPTPTDLLPDRLRPNPKPANPPSDSPQGPKLAQSGLGSPVLSPDGSKLLGRYATKQGITVGVWDLKAGDFYSSVARGLVDGEFGISSDNTQVAVVSLPSDALTLWEIPSGRLIKTIKLTSGGDENRLPPFVKFTADGKAVVTCFKGRLIRVDLDAASEKLLAGDINTREAVYSLQKNVAADFKFIEKANRNEVRIFDLSKGGNPRTIAPPGDDSLISSTTALSDDGSTFAVGVLGGPAGKQFPTIYIHDAGTGVITGTIPFADGQKTPELDDVKLSPDGKWLLALGSYGPREKRTYVRYASDIASGTSIQINPNDMSYTQATDFARDGKTIAYATDGKVRVLSQQDFMGTPPKPNKGPSVVAGWKSVEPPEKNFRVKLPDPYLNANSILEQEKVTGILLIAANEIRPSKLGHESYSAGTVKIPPNLTGAQRDKLIATAERFHGAADVPGGKAERKTVLVGGTQWGELRVSDASGHKTVVIRTHVAGNTIYCVGMVWIGDAPSSGLPDSYFESFEILK